MKLVFGLDLPKWAIESIVLRVNARLFLHSMRRSLILKHSPT